MKIVTNDCEVMVNIEFYEFYFTLDPVGYWSCWLVRRICRSVTLRVHVQVYESLNIDLSTSFCHTAMSGAVDFNQHSVTKYYRCRQFAALTCACENDFYRADLKQHCTIGEARSWTSILRRAFIYIHLYNRKLKYILSVHSTLPS